MATKPAGPPKLTNLYYLRTVGTEKSCFVCGKFTTQCLATQDVSDFVYTCTSHLADPGFAKPAASATSSSPSTPSGTPPSTPSTVPQSEIDKVKKEYEAKLAAKDKALADANSSSSSSSSWISSGIKTVYSAGTSLASTTLATINPPTPVVPPSPSEVARAVASNSKVFVLHRSIFAMRQDAAKKKWQVQEAKERAKGLSLPAVPRTAP